MWLNNKMLFVLPCCSHIHALAIEQTRPNVVQVHSLISTCCHSFGFSSAVNFFPQKQSISKLFSNQVHFALNRRHKVGTPFVLLSLDKYLPGDSNTDHQNEHEGSDSSNEDRSASEKEAIDSRLISENRGQNANNISGSRSDQHGSNNNYKKQLTSSEDLVSLYAQLGPEEILEAVLEALQLQPLSIGPERLYKFSTISPFGDPGGSTFFKNGGKKTDVFRYEGFLLVLRQMPYSELLGHHKRKKLSVFRRKLSDDIESCVIRMLIQDSPSEKEAPATSSSASVENVDPENSTGNRDRGNSSYQDKNNELQGASVFTFTLLQQSATSLLSSGPLDWHIHSIEHEPLNP